MARAAPLCAILVLTQCPLERGRMKAMQNPQDYTTIRVRKSAVPTLTIARIKIAEKLNRLMTSADVVELLATYGAQSPQAVADMESAIHNGDGETDNTPEEETAR